MSGLPQGDHRLTPKWVAPVALVALLTGLAIVVFGPMLIWAVAVASADAELAPEMLADQKVVAEHTQQRIKTLLDRWFWIFPVAGALGFGGMIGLILAWVSRPLGDDLDEPG